MLNGSCLCGAIRYRLASPIQSIKHCHCSQCRKGHGAAFASYANVRRDSFELVQGAEALGVYSSSSGMSRSFCKQCGSSVLWHSDNSHAEWLSVALGTLDSPLGEVRQKHIFTESKADWYAIADGLPIEPCS